MGIVRFFKRLQESLRHSVWFDFAIGDHVSFQDGRSHRRGTITSYEIGYRRNESRVCYCVTIRTASGTDMDFWRYSECLTLVKESDGRKNM